MTSNKWNQGRQNTFISEDWLCIRDYLIELQIQILVAVWIAPFAPGQFRTGLLVNRYIHFEATNYLMREELAYFAFSNK